MFKPRDCPDASFFGGPVTPWFETAPPLWIANNLHMIIPCFAIRHALDEPVVPISPGYIPCGANMATRRHCFEHSSFDIRLGPQRDTEIRGEETVLLGQFLNLGLEGRMW